MSTTLELQGTSDIVEPLSKIDPKKERAILKADYAVMLLSRWSFSGTRDLSGIFKRHQLPQESICLRTLEEKCFDIPEWLDFNELIQSIPDQHRVRMFGVWSALLRMRSLWQHSVDNLQEKWREAPTIKDPIAEEIVDRHIGDTHQAIRKALCAVVRWPDESNLETNRSEISIFEDQDPLVEKARRAYALGDKILAERGNQPEADRFLATWQYDEKANRLMLFAADKNYLTALRLYLEMLLEKSKTDKTKDVPPVLPLDHLHRFDIVTLNRIARCVDAEHQGFAIAKAIHHAQPDGRLRKSLEAFLKHVWEVMQQYSADVGPHVIEKEQMTHNPVLGILAAALHDIAEDSKVTLDEIYDYIKRLADKYDSSFDQVIESGFGASREEIKSVRLDLIGESEWNSLRRILRVLSDNTEYTDDEKRGAVQRNNMGFEATKRILKLDNEKGDAQLASWGVVHGKGTPQEGKLKKELPPPLKVFQKYPPAQDAKSEKHLAKLDRFILRLVTILPDKLNKDGSISAVNDLKQYALINKMEDRANNLMDLKLDPPKKQLEKLRATTTRLIAYAMLDYPLKKYPLYNALPRLIDVTLGEYERLEKEEPSVLDASDKELIVQLKQWQREVPRFISKDIPSCSHEKLKVE